MAVGLTLTAILRVMAGPNAMEGNLALTPALALLYDAREKMPAEEL
jgi:hypothetical protein